ncbi:MAG: AAA family ATPase [Burkholderiales bacterium]|nr:AAA family ATPase [Burkholderiales bacterium]
MTMYLEHFGLREAPFKITPHTEFFFAGANRGETLEALIYAITSGEGIVKVTGEVGAGKTMLCRVLMERLPQSVETIYFAVPSLSPDELIATVASDLGVATDGVNITKLIRALQVRLIEIYGSGKRVVALIDEAHAMPVETLDQIRLLSNLETSHEKLMQIVLFGQPELDKHLSMPNIRQLKERITHSFNLLPLPPRDIKDYLNFRLRAAGYRGPDLFSPEALKVIADASEGLTRRINIYADKTLLAAFAAGTHTITTDHVRAAITDTQIVLPVPKSNRKQIGFVIAAALLVGVAVGFVAGQQAMSTNAPAVLPAKAAPVVSAPASPILDISKSPADAPATITAPAPNIGQVAANNRMEMEKAAPTRPAPANSPANKSTPGERLIVVAPTVAVAVPLAADDGVNRTSSASDWLGKRLAADALRIATLPKNRYAVQLMTADERNQSAIESYLRIASNELKADSILLLPTGNVNDPRVTVVYGNFDGAPESTAEIGVLSARVSKFRPYVRSFCAIRADIRRNSP